MTLAICIKCGARKHGALTPCPRCEFDPESHADRARAMILTDHWHSSSDLDRFAKQIEAGEEVCYPRELLANYVKTFEENPGIVSFPKGLLIGLVLVACAGIAALLWWAAA